MEGFQLPRISSPKELSSLMKENEEDFVPKGMQDLGSVLRAAKLKKEKEEQEIAQQEKDEIPEGMKDLGAVLRAAKQKKLDAQKEEEERKIAEEKQRALQGGLMAAFASEREFFSEDEDACDFKNILEIKDGKEALTDSQSESNETSDEDGQKTPKEEANKIMGSIFKSDIDENKPTTPKNSLMARLFKQKADDGSDRKKLLAQKKRDAVRTQIYEQAAEAQLVAFQKEFRDNFPTIAHKMSQERLDNPFANFWSKIILVTHTYNIMTCFWYMGFEGFPTGTGLYMEVCAEIVGMFDFVIRLILKKYFPHLWETMWVLHSPSDNSLAFTCFKFIGTLPQSLIMANVLRNNRALLESFGLACLRLVKLIRFRPFHQYFDVVSIKQNPRQTFLLQVVEVLYNFLLATILIGQIWMILGRFQGEVGWFKMAFYYDFEVSRIQRFMDSIIFVVATMCGLGFGNIVPSTNGEWFVTCFIMIAGSSIYANYFATFAIQMAEAHKKQIENTEKFEQAKMLAHIRHLPDEVKLKIRYYFKNLRMSFEEFKLKNQIVDELPSNLKENMVFKIHHQLINNFKMFNQGNPEFVLEWCNYLEPQIVMINEYIVTHDELANRMYLIHQGVCEVLATDGKTLIQFLNKGGYFGEIGALFTGTRTCSVISRTTTILYAIHQKNLTKVLDKHPIQKKFLRAVCRQRMLTTSKEHINRDEFEEQFILEQQIKELPADENVFGFLSERSDHSNLPSLQSEFAANVQKRFEAADKVKGIGSMMRIKSNQGFNIDFTNKKPKLWETKQFYNLENFLIVPLSPLFYLWNAILVLVIGYDIFMVIFHIAMDFRITGVFMALDILCIVILAFDIWMRSKTAITTPNKYCFDPKEITDHYVKTWLALDALVILPFGYFMEAAPGIDPKYIQWARIFRLLKFGRLLEIVEIFENHTNIRVEFFRLMRLGGIFILFAHIMGSGYAYIGATQYLSGNRFDGQSLFGDMVGRNFTPPLKVEEMSKGDIYKEMFYLGCSFMGAVMYGDIIPFTPIEQVYTIFTMCTCRIYLAMVFAECANYLSSVHQTKANHIQKRERTIEWMKQNQFPRQIQDRFQSYNGILWEYFQGINEQSILQELPRTLRLEIRFCVFKNLIKNWEKTMTDCSQGMIKSVIKELKMVIYPKDEYIITNGEIGTEMYFIVKGMVQCLTDKNEILGTLKHGDSFGEMSCLDKNQKQRTNSVVAMTVVSLGYLTSKDFNKVCKQYPNFKDQLQQLSLKRVISNESQRSDSPFSSVSPLKQRRTTLEINTVMPIQQNNDQSQDSFFNASQPPLKREENEGGEEEAKVEESLNANEESKAQGPTMRHQRISSAIIDSSNDQEFQVLPHQPNQIGGVVKRSDSKRVSQDVPLIRRIVSNTEVGTYTQDEAQGSQMAIDSNCYPDLHSPSPIQLMPTQATPEQTFIPVRAKSQNMGAKIQSEVQPIDEYLDDVSAKQRPRKRTSLDKSSRRLMKSHSSCADYYNTVNLQADVQEKKSYPWFQRTFQIGVLICSIYNYIFIPLQLAFRIPMKGLYLWLEIITILFYGTEIVMRVIALNNLMRIQDLPLKQIKDLNDRKLKVDKDLFDAAVSTQKYEIVTSTIAVIPVSLIISYTKTYEPWGIIAILVGARLIKIRPLYKMYQWLQTHELNMMRILEALNYYYFIIHYLCCVVISMAAYKPDARDTWLRRVPSPQFSGSRATANVFDDVSPFSLYIHAQIYEMNTLSHVAVGDNDMVTVNERFLNGFHIWFGTFCYCLLFGNVTAIVTNIGTGPHINFYRNYNNIVSRFKNGKVPQHLVDSIREYFDYQWSQNRGIDVIKMKDDLPSSISEDLQISQYSGSIETCLLFCVSTGNIDFSLAKSLFKYFEMKTFMCSDYIIKAGQTTKETYFLLEGEIRVYGLNGQLLGSLSKGCHFGLDLNKNEAENDIIQKCDPKFHSQMKMKSSHDNFHSRSTLHLVANSFVTVGIIQEEDRLQIYKTYPEFKQKMRIMNRLMFQIGKNSWEQHQLENNLEIRKSLCKQEMLKHITYSNSETYDQIIDSNLFNSNLEIDLHELLKRSLLNVNEFNTENSDQEQSNLFQDRIFKVNSTHGRASYNSKRQNVVIDKKRSFTFDKDSTFIQVYQLVEFTNLMWVCFMTPFMVMFDIHIGIVVTTLEIVSLMISVLSIIIKLRTFVLLKGQKTLKLGVVIKNYKNEGMFSDIAGIIPFNLILGIIFKLSKQKTSVMLVLMFFRQVRMLSVSRAAGLFLSFEVYLKNATFMMGTIKAILVVYLLAHWMTCAWFFLVNTIEHEAEQTWATINTIADKNLAERYLLSFYLILNIVTSVGYGDMYPVTTIERIFFSCLMTSGDCLFAFAFALITQISMNNKQQSDQLEFEEHSEQLTQIMDVYNISIHQKHKVQKYFVYEFYQNSKSTMVDTAELLKHIPASIVQEIIYHTNKELLEPMFKDFKSDNMIKGLSQALTGEIFLPKELIIKKGETSTSMYFIVEGTVHVLSDDQTCVVKTLAKGEYFGEVAIFCENKRDAFMQAATFCLVNSLKKEDFDEISSNFPLVAKTIKEIATIKKREIDSLSGKTVESKKRRLSSVYLKESK